VRAERIFQEQRAAAPAAPTAKPTANPNPRFVPAAAPTVAPTVAPTGEGAGKNDTRTHTHTHPHSSGTSRQTILANPVRPMVVATAERLDAHASQCSDAAVEDATTLASSPTSTWGGETGHA